MSVDQQQKQLPAKVDKTTAYPVLAGCEFNDGAIQLNSFSAIQEFAEIASGCGFFEDAKSVQQAIIKISYGTRLGLDPLESINGIYVNRGRFGIWAKVIAQKIKEHPRYDYNVIESNEKICVLEAVVDGVKQKNHIKFTIEQAREMGVTANKPWKVDPEQMLFYKAVTRLKDRYCPDVFKAQIASIEDLSDLEFSESYKKERPDIVKQAQLEAAQDRAADKILTSKQLDKALDEALDVTTVDEIPYDDGKGISQPKPEFQDRMEGRARVQESEGDTKAAEETRAEAQKIAELKADIKAVSWSNLVMKATTSKYGTTQIRKWLEARGVDLKDPKAIPQAELQAAMAEMDSPK